MSFLFTASGQGRNNQGSLVFGPHPKAKQRIARCAVPHEIKAKHRFQQPSTKKLSLPSCHETTISRDRFPSNIFFPSWSGQNPQANGCKGTTISKSASLESVFWICGLDLLGSGFPSILYIRTRASKPNPNPQSTNCDYCAFQLFMFLYC